MQENNLRSQLATVRMRLREIREDGSFYKFWSVATARENNCGVFSNNETKRQTFSSNLLISKVLD